MRHAYPVLCLIAIIIPVFATGSTWVVCPDGSGDAATIEAAITVAASGDTIALCDGVFTGSGNRDLVDQGKSFALISLSNDPASCIIDCQGSAGEPHYALRLDGDEADTAAIVGIGFRNGWHDYGGALKIAGGAGPTITSCRFKDNTSNDGGAVSVSGGSNPTILACEFTGNDASNAGGGIRFETATGLVSGCMFHDGYAYWGGGGIYLYESDPRIEQCLFVDNEAHAWGSAIEVHMPNSDPQILECTIYGGVAPDGSIHVRGGAQAIIETSIVAFATSGAGISCDGSSLAAPSYCDVYGNAGGDWVGCIADWEDVEGNIAADPLFCDSAGGDFTLNVASPCLPPNSPGSVQIGAFGAGCGFTPQVVSHTPAAYEAGVDLDEWPTVTFDHEIDFDSLSSLTLRLYGQLSGVLRRGVVYQPDTHTLVIQPIETFKTGELITCTLTPGITSDEGVPMAAGYSLSFLADAAFGTADFVDGPTPALADYPLGMAAGDLDGDGDIDLLNADSGGHISVLLNEGDASFAPRIDLEVQFGAHDICLVDVDHDWDLDAVVAERLSQKIWVLRNDGTGGFTVSADYIAGSVPSNPVAGDFDGDGHQDIAVANAVSGPKTVSILLNEGGGSFAERVAYPVGSRPARICAGDLDGDGDLDLACANIESDDISLLYNEGDGTFGAPTNLPVGDWPLGIAGGDLNGDSFFDLVVAVSVGDQAVVLLNDGTGGFLAPVGYGPINGPNYVALGDLDGDDDLDLAVASNSAGQWITLYLNQGDGSFLLHDAISPQGPNAHWLLAADLDGDQDLDLAANCNGTPMVSIHLNSDPTGVPDLPERNMAGARLLPNQPNPFNPITRIAYETASPGRVRLEIFDLRGRLVATLVDGPVVAGRHEVTWDGRTRTGTDVPSGVYVSRLAAGGTVVHGRMMLVR